VKAANIAELMAQPDIDGALVGGASLKPDEMAGIVARAADPADEASRTAAPSAFGRRAAFVVRSERPRRAPTPDRTAAAYAAWCPTSADDGDYP